MLIYLLFMKNLYYIILFLFITNCSFNKVVNHHGVHFLEKKNKKLIILETNIKEIIAILGPPSTKSSFDNDIWIYLERKTSKGSIYKLGKNKTTVNNTNIIQSYEIDNVYKMLVIIIAGVIFLFSLTAMIFLYCYNTKNTIRDVPNDNQEQLNNFYHYKTEPRIIHNSMYSSVSSNPGEYIEVEEDNSSLDDEEDVEQSINYLRYNTHTTDF